MKDKWIGKLHNGIKLYPDTRFKNRYYDFDNIIESDTYHEYSGIEIPKGTKYVLAEKPVSKTIYMVFERPIIDKNTNWSIDMVRYEE
jgi:hypothetical protein